MELTKDQVEASGTWPVQRFVREVCRAADYSPQVQELARTGFYAGKKLKDVIKQAKEKCK